MKRISFLVLVALMVFTVGNAFGVGLSVTNVDGLYNTDTIATGTAITFDITWDQAGAGYDVTGSSNGYRVYSPSGAPVTASGEWNPAVDWTVPYDGGNFVAVFPSASDDTVGFGGFRLFGPGILDGFVDVAHIIHVDPIPDSEDGGTLCIDSSWYAPSNPWLWSSTAGAQSPPWSGPHCYTLYKVPHIFPTISNDPGSVSGSHCGAITYDFDMQINDTDNPAPPQTFEVVSGEGTINPSTGEWSFAPNQGNVGQALSVEVRACDAIGCGPSVTVSINVTNIGPSITCGGDVAVGKGNTVVAPIASASDGDCDAISFFDGGVNPAPTGGYSVDASTGTLTFNTDVSDCGQNGQTFAFTIGVTDGIDTAYCTQNVEVLCTEPFEIQIEKTHNTYQGGHELVDVTVNKGSEEMRGFDILIGYDPSALSLQAALEGDPYSACGWEYFNWRYGPNGNCSGGCPSGKVKVVGIADMNNGPNHPSCFMPGVPFTLFSLDFLVTDNRLFECQYVPIRFWWLDCTDNSIAYNPQSDPTDQVIEQGISRYVIDFDLIGHIENGSVGFPTYMGAQDECLNTDPNKPTPIRFVDFLNGGIDIVCADSIDARGDINLNGTANEIADGVLFTNYFIYGLGVFQVNVQGQIAASDVNADGITLSVADLVTLIRIIVGDQNGTPKIAPVNATLTSTGGVYSVDSRMGAAYLEVEGNVAPQLLADGMEMKYNFDGNSTRIIISSINGNSFEGSFVDVGNATVTNFELATDEGAPVAATAKIVPTSFSLAQNYPNPFNPRTTVAFNLAVKSDWTLSIYNITGQRVAEFSGTSDAGEQMVSWDAADNASGIYFYKLNAGDFSQTKKMVLLK